MKMIFVAFAIIAGVFLEKQAVAATQYEAESATLSGTASKATDHTGYTGTGFVAGFTNSTTAQVSFTVSAATAGNYTVTLRYSAGSGTSTNVGLYVRGTKIKNITCNSTTNWDTWANEVETVSLTAGNNTIAYKTETSSGSGINLDNVIVNTACTNVSITTQPGNASVAAPATAIFTVVASGTTPAYQWQQSTNNGTTFTNISGATSTSYTTVATTTSMSGYKYRCYVSNSCPSNATSNAATLTVTTGNRPPTDISLSATNVAENKPANSVVGTFSATDPDAGSTFTFSLVSGTGSTDNGSFGIVSGNQLVTTAPFDFETKNSYSIRVRVLDNGGLPYEKQFTVTVTDVSEYADPTMTPATGSQLTGPSVTVSWTAVIGAYTYDLDMGSTLGGADLYNGTPGTARTATVSGLPQNGSPIYVRLTTTDVGGPHTFDFIYTAYSNKPKALDVHIYHKNIQVGVGLLGVYTYSDDDPEGATTFKWYRADDANGTGKTEITGATALQYTPVNADENEYLQFEVTPRASAGVIDGIPTLSAFIGPVATRDGLTYVFPKDCGDKQNMKVNGRIKCNSLLIQNWLLSEKGMPATPDYVFAKGYNLPALAEIEQYININGHLPEVPSAKDLEANGVDMIRLNFTLLKKVEEMTLYAIKQDKRIQEQEKRMQEMEKKINK